MSKSSAGQACVHIVSLGGIPGNTHLKFQASAHDLQDSIMKNRTVLK